VVGNEWGENDKIGYLAREKKRWVQSENRNVYKILTLGGQEELSRKGEELNSLNKPGWGQEKGNETQKELSGGEEARKDWIAEGGELRTKIARGTEKRGADQTNLPPTERAGNLRGESLISRNRGGKKKNTAA